MVFPENRFASSAPRVTFSHATRTCLAASLAGHRMAEVQGPAGFLLQ